MNQILYEDVQTQKTDINKILMFFAIIIIVFGLALVGSGIVGFINKKEDKTSTLIIGTKPEVSTCVFEEDKVLIQVKHDKTIDKILYNWNNGEEKTILGIQRSNIEEIIDMPMGENVLSIRVIDIAGEQTNYTQTYVLSSGVDIQKPTINLSVIDNTKIKVTAQDETEISYLTYRWNNEEETKEDVTDESKTKIEVTIPIQRGENDLTVIAVDANNNTETKVQKFNAVTRPTINVKQYADKLTIIIKDEQGLEKVEYSLNGKNYRWVKSTEDKTEWIYEQKIPEGVSKIIINAWNTKGVKADEFRGQCNYTP